MMNTKDIMEELIQNQREYIPSQYKLRLEDISRISCYVTASLFQDDCCEWKGFLNEKNLYINFFFNKKKMSLTRLLYINYIGDLEQNEYITNSCGNKGKCCCINHIVKKNKGKKLKKILKKPVVPRLSGKICFH